jgi:hypothetical protein
MISELDLEYVHGHGESHALCWVIDGECLYDLALNHEYANLFLLNEGIEDVSALYPENSGITLRFFKDDSIWEELNVNEYFGNILLSPHKVINLLGHAYGDYVTSPYANFTNNEFVVTDQDMTILEPFYNGVPAKECTPENCHCYRADNV